MVDETKSSNRTLVLALAVGAILLTVVVGILIVVMVLGRDGSGEGAATADSAKFMPDDTLVFAAFNPHLDQVRTLRSSKRPGATTRF